MMRDIVAMTPRPKHVKESIDEFIKRRIRKKFVSMHWRYNDEDWSMHCKVLMKIRWIEMKILIKTSLKM
jgi:hypothetical protein